MRSFGVVHPHPTTGSDCNKLGNRSLTQFLVRQARGAGVAAPDDIAEQLTVLHTGAADYALLYGHYPDSTRTAVASLLTAAGL